MKPVEVIVAGAGSRGMGYSQYALSYPERMKVIGVAEPRGFYRKQMIQDHSIPEENVFTDWKDMAAREKFADAVIIATQDAMHVEPAVEFSKKGYAVLLEKPMAPTAEGCKKIIQAVKENNILFAVAHVLRYTAFTRKLKELIDRGAIGEVIGIDRVEPVGFWHMAHSFVRGNWRNEEESSFMLLAKSCHDIDWIHYIMGERCHSVSSFGSLRHFRSENAPDGAARRCIDCLEVIESNCPYSAKRIYIKGCLMTGHTGWPLDVITSDTTMDGVMDALRTGPYGRCVYRCDNDVVDHQVVNMEFENGKTATFTMMAFTRQEHRSTRIFGTRGEIKADGSTIELYDFLTDRVEKIETAASDGSILGGHGGGDFGLIHDFIEAVANRDSNMVLTGPEETLASHLMVFAAEKARLEHRVVNL